MIRFKTSTFIIHAAGWLLFLVFPLLFMNSGQKGTSAWGLVFSSYYWLFCLTYLVLFYFNAWYLVPYFLFKRKYITYIIVLIGLFSSVYFLQPFDKLLAHNPRMQAQMDRLPPILSPNGPPANAMGQNPTLTQEEDTAGPTGAKYPFGPLPHQDLRMQETKSKPSGINPLWQHSQHLDTVSLFIFLIIMALSLAVTTVQQYQQTEQKVVKAEAEKANAELSFLKAQINPHFLFNTLNNIYTLSVMNSEHTSDSIMKLSNIMRYVTDDVEEDFVSLQSEIDCVNDYIDLQRLRLGSKAQVNFDISGRVTHQKIAPLILMPFVENTFKYGISKQEASIIDIGLNIEGEKIEFYCNNKIFASKMANVERTGIGIANTRQRLEHLYPQKHLLNINDQNGFFKVRLVLNG